MPGTGSEEVPRFSAGGENQVHGISVEEMDVPRVPCLDLRRIQVNLGGKRVYIIDPPPLDNGRWIRDVAGT